MGTGLTPAQTSSPDEIHTYSFLVARSAGSAACESSVTEMCSVCEELGFPLAEDKLEGSAWVITFLGIELDSATMQI